MYCYAYSMYVQISSIFLTYSTSVTVSVYVIYKPWLGGVYAEYTTRGRGQRKFAAKINPERSEGFIEAANFR